MDEPQPTRAAPTQRMTAIVQGVVQGVNFRAYTVRAARQLGLVGWVRNKSDGTVETVAEGTQEGLSAFIDFLHSGSPSAHVRSVDVAWADAQHEMDSFGMRYS